MERVMQWADRLANAIGEDERSRRLAAARGAAEKDEAAKKLLDDYRGHMTRLAELSRSGKPIEPADKHKVDELQTAMAGSPPLRELAAAEADFVQMMRRVYQKLDTVVEPK